MFTTVTIVCAEAPPSVGDGQIGVPLSWQACGDDPSSLCMLQKTRDSVLYLTPNESFFPMRGLVAAGQSQVPDLENLNSGKSFAWIEKWDAGDVAEWVWFAPQAGEGTITLWMSAKSDGGTFSMSMDNKTVSFAVKSSENPSSVFSCPFKVTNPGLHRLRIVCDKAAAGIQLHWMTLSGPCIEDGAVVRKRWRPSAAHTKFSSSQARKPIRLWVMEMDAVPGDLGFYAPITTPFGYYGPTWQADGTVNAGFNFSLWSYGRGKEEPPIEQLSHLLAIGHRDATFGGFGHEGTGVKIRDWDPLLGHQGQRQVLALRVVPSETYDTYYSYYYVADENEWRLFGVGNKYNKGKPLKSLWVGSFVEVPGPPHVQRTGLYPREMRYRGWVVQEDGQLLQLDHMSGGDVDKQTGLTYTHRGVTDDGWFFLRTGGLSFHKPLSASGVDLSKDNHLKDLPAYLSPEHKESLLSVPSEVTVQSVAVTPEGLKIDYRIDHLGKAPELEVYWGTQDGLTFVDRWEHSERIPNVKEGKNEFTLKSATSLNNARLRLFLKNDDGQFWSANSTRVTK
ncbi:DUF3472 domain-containing protein [Pirellulales bacterium]|nr:DUF3472 domain-containing protein [Pirellulales bacterium]